VVKWDADISKISQTASSRVRSGGGRQAGGWRAADIAQAIAREAGKSVANPTNRKLPESKRQ